MAAVLAGAGSDYMYSDERYDEYIGTGCAARYRPMVPARKLKWYLSFSNFKNLKYTHPKTS